MYFNIIIISLCIIIYVLLSLSKKMSVDTKNKVFLILAFSIFFFLMATRTYSTGSDTPMYVRTFLNFAKTKWNSQIFGGYFEPLYALTNILLSYITTNPRILIVVTSAFISFSFYKFIKDNSKDPLLSIVMFIGLLFFYGTMNTIRQYMAISVLLLAFKFVKDKKLWLYIPMVFIAFLFHSTALVGILIYPIYNAKYSHIRVLIIFVIAIIANLNILELINKICELIGRPNYYEHRVDQKNIANILFAAMYFCMYLYSLFEIRKRKKDENNSNAIKNNSIIGNDSFYLYSFVMASAFSIIAIRMNVLARITTYFDILLIICLPNVIQENVVKKNRKLIMRILVIIMFVVYSTILIKFRPNWNTAYNYKSMFFTKEEAIVIDK